MSPKTWTAASTGFSTPDRRGTASNSTIVACLGGRARLLRPGAIEREKLEAALGETLESGRGGPAIAPGMLTSHYAPRARLRLNAEEAEESEAALDFAAKLERSPAMKRLDLSPSGDLSEAAAHLFAYLRELDASGPQRIAVGGDSGDRARRRHQRPLTPRRGAERMTKFYAPRVVTP